MRIFTILILTVLLIATSDLKIFKSIKANLVYSAKYDLCLNDYKGRTHLQNKCIADLKRQYK